jgi:hypothetical protein
MKLMKNKKGDIPVTILVLGIVLICILTIASFYVSALIMKSNFDIGAIKQVKLMREKIDVYQNLGIPEPQAEIIMGVKTLAQGNAQIKYLSVDYGYIAVNYTVSSVNSPSPVP